MALAGVALLYADTRLDIAGFVLLVLGLGVHALRVRRARPVVAA
jgi:hypothetical protein